MSFWERLIGGGHHRSGGHHGSYRRDMPYQPSAAGIACPSCRAVSYGNARFCQSCGLSLAPQACSGCGAALLVGNRFCTQCGTPAIKP